MEKGRFGEKCKSCGRLVRDRAMFCLDCGEPVNGFGLRKSSRGSSACPDDGGETKEHEIASLIEASAFLKEDPPWRERESDRAASFPEFLVLKVCRGMKKREECVFAGKGEFIIGRSIESDLILRDRTVSRRHAAICRTKRGWKIKDLGSANGTYVNGRRTSESSIGPGDIVVVGKALLLVSS